MKTSVLTLLISFFSISSFADYGTLRGTYQKKEVAETVSKYIKDQKSCENRDGSWDEEGRMCFTKLDEAMKIYEVESGARIAVINIATNTNDLGEEECQIVAKSANLIDRITLRLNNIDGAPNCSIKATRIEDEDKNQGYRIEAENEERCEDVCSEVGVHEFFKVK